MGPGQFLSETPAASRVRVATVKTKYVYEPAQRGPVGLHIEPTHLNILDGMSDPRLVLDHLKHPLDHTSRTSPLHLGPWRRACFTDPPRRGSRQVVAEVRGAARGGDGGESRYVAVPAEQRQRRMKRGRQNFAGGVGGCLTFALRRRAVFAPVAVPVPPG